MLVQCSPGLYMCSGVDLLPVAARLAPSHERARPRRRVTMLSLQHNLLLLPMTKIPGCSCDIEERQHLSNVVVEKP